MKQKIFSLLVLVMTAVTASAIEVPTYSLNKAQGADAHGTIQFYVDESDNLVEVSSAADGQTVTMIITPNTGYEVNVVSGEWEAVTAAARGQHRSSSEDIPTEDVITLNHVSTDANGIATYTFEMIRAKATISCSYKKLLSNTEITVEDIADLTYTGVAQTPTVTVKDGTTTLTLWNDQTQQGDYTVSYSNNVNAASATAQSAPTVTITAVETSEKYAGSTTKTFTINKAALTVTADNKQVAFGDDAPQYTVSYDGFVNNQTESVLGSMLELACAYVKNQTVAGTYDITPSGLTSNNYEITFEKGTLTVGKKALTNNMIATIADQTYNGTLIKPEPAVTFNNMTLAKGTDFTYSYQNNVNAAQSTAQSAPTVTITAVSNSTKYSGSASKTFTIVAADFTVSFDEASVTKTVGDIPFTNTLTSELTYTATYESSDPTVAAVDETTGEVTVLHAGKATITATVTANGNFNPMETSFEIIVNKQVTQDKPGNRILWDGSDYYVEMDENVATSIVLPEDICDAHLSYHRVLTVSNSQPKNVDGETRYLFTICMPFVPQMFATKFYTLAGVSNGVLQFAEIEDRPKAFTPYLVCVKEDASVKNKRTVIFNIEDGNLDNFTIHSEEIDDLNYISKQDMSFCRDVVNGAAVDGYQLCGTLRGLTNADAAEAGAFILQTDGTWGAVKAGNETVYIPPFRAYVVAASAMGTRLSTAFGEGGATGIERIVTTDLDGTEHWYDLNGRRIEKPTTKGVYIQNGKKTVIK